jgi:hypothetical protein
MGPVAGRQRRHVRKEGDRIAGHRWAVIVLAKDFRRRHAVGPAVDDAFRRGAHRARHGNCARQRGCAEDGDED